MITTSSLTQEQQKELEQAIKRSGIATPPLNDMAHDGTWNLFDVEQENGKSRKAFFTVTTDFDQFPPEFAEHVQPTVIANFGFVDGATYTHVIYKK